MKNVEKRPYSKSLSVYIDRFKPKIAIITSLMKPKMAWWKRFRCSVFGDMSLSFRKQRCSCPNGTKRN